MDSGNRAQQRLLARLDDETLLMLETVLERLLEAARADALEQGIVIPDDLENHSH